MNNKFIYILYCVVWLVCGSLMLQGCTDEDAAGTTSGDETRLRLSITDLKEVQVRGLAGDPSDGYVTEWYDIYVYRGTDPDAAPFYHVRRRETDPDVYGSRYIPGMVGDGSSSPAISLGIVPQDGDRIYVFLNCDQTGTKFTGTISENELKETVVDPFPDNVPISNKVPFSGSVTWDSNRDNLFLMQRLSAKVRVKITAPNTKVISGLIICNAPKHAWVLGGHTLAYQETGEWTGTETNCAEEVMSGWYGDVPGVDIPEYRSSVHSAMNGGQELDAGVFSPQRMAVVMVLLEVKEGITKPFYYRLDFFDKDNGVYMDILRGFRYTFNITKIHSEGYSNLEEALNMPGSNLEYEVTVNDSWAGGHEYNGQYQLNISRETLGLLPNITDPASFVKIELQNNDAGEADFTKLKSRQVRLVDKDGYTLDGTRPGGSPLPIQLWYHNPATGQNMKAPGNVADASMLAGTTSWVFCYTTDANFTESNVAVQDCALEVVMGNMVKYVSIKCLPSVGAKELDQSGTANCYIVSPMGGRYSFGATIIGNGVQGVTVANTFQSAKDATFLTPGNVADVTIAPQSAKLLWQDKKGLISQVAYHDGRVEFVVSDTGQAGNAVIAVYDKPDPNAADAMVLWSWHIWCAPRPVDIPVKPEAGTELAAGEKYVFMDRNVGAEDSKEVGMYYQYGRKDPFIDYKTRGHEHIYDLLGRDVTALLKKLSDSFERYETVRYPLTYSNVNMEYGAVWGSNSTSPDQISNDVKTIYDPCPPGYKVPDMRPIQILRSRYFLTGKYETKDGTPFIIFSTLPIGLYFPNGGHYYDGVRYSSTIKCWTTGGGGGARKVLSFYRSESGDKMDEVDKSGLETQLLTQVRCISE